MCEEPPTNDKMHVEVLSKPPSIGIHSKVQVLLLFFYYYNFLHSIVLLAFCIDEVCLCYVMVFNTLFWK